MDHKQKHTKLIKVEAERLGFSGCGIAEAVYLGEEAEYLEHWISRRYHGNMKYMERNMEKRKDPRLLFKGAQSIVSVILNYYPHKVQTGDVPEIAKYAYGKDYHQVVKNKLFQLLKYIQSKITSVKGKVCVDTAPFMDIAWAKRSGLGWIGKNTLLITPDYGSYVVIGELILNIELEYDHPVKKSCGTCTKCIDACPTGALVEPYVLDAGKCISYLNIENRNEFSHATRLHGWIFGCDICQDVCPFNNNPVPHNTPAFDPKPEIFRYTKKDWLKMQKTEFKRLFKDSAIERTGYEVMQRNIRTIIEH